MFRHTAERVIKRPVDQVFGFLADATRQTEWVHGVSACRWQGAGAGPGAVAEQTMTFLGKTRIEHMTVVEWEPGRRVAFEKQRPFKIRFGFELAGEGEATRVRYPVEMAPTGLMKLIIALVGRKIIEGDLVRIAKALEG